MTKLRLALLVTATTLIAAHSSAETKGDQAHATGRRLYQAYCASCHGAGGQGDGPDARIFAVPPRNLREGFLARYRTDDLVGRVREGKPLELALDLPALRARAADVEAVVAYLKRLPTVDGERTAAGHAVYLDRCALCHGMYGRASGTRPPGVRPPRDLGDPTFQQSLDDNELVLLVRHGRKGMPALVPRVEESDARVLGAFLRLLSPGFELYARYCASCHGDDGRGGGNLAAAVPRPTVAFDAAYFSRHEPEALRAKVWHMVEQEKPRMPHYRNVLSAVQARAIVEYLKHSRETGAAGRNEG